MKRFIIIVHLTFTAIWAFGQEPVQDSIYFLPGVEVSATRIEEFTAGQKVQQLDGETLSAAGTSNLGELLYRNTAININRYNLNGLNLLSVRGTSASQSSVYWNGFQLNPPNNGQIDLSIIPVNYFNNVSILFGGSSSLFGSGNIGAGIHLNNKPVFKNQNQYIFGASAGSFDDYSANIKAMWASPKWYFGTQAMGRTAQNDFQYENLDGKTVNYQNAALNQKGFMQDIFHKFNKEHIAGVSLWYQENDKEVPATLTSKASNATQNDRALRAVLTYRYATPKTAISTKIAVFNDFQHYTDPDNLPSLSIDSEIETTRIQGDLSIKRQIGKFTVFDAGIEGMELLGKSVNYPENISQQQGGLFLLVSQQIPSIDWVLNLNLRQEYNSDFEIPFTPAFGLMGPICKNLSIKANISHNFRVPTFNDLYWIPGGNPDLKPESSWNQELGLFYKTDSIMELKTIIEATIFNSNVDNWIMWIPDGNLWSPINIREVWSRGIELSLEVSRSFGNYSASLSGNYSYIRSTNEKQLSNNDPTYQKQLIYVPENRYQISLSLIKNQWNFSADHSFNGRSYVTADNTESLADYALLNMSVKRNFMPWGNRLSVQAELLNILNEKYQAVQYFPMPGRTIKLSIQLTINR